jgi:hypothetical protein
MSIDPRCGVVPHVNHDPEAADAPVTSGIVFTDACGLTHSDRMLILRDALIEFICNRIGFPEEPLLIETRARQYVDERYAGQTLEWRARKVPEVIARWECAKKMLEALGK